MSLTVQTDRSLVHMNGHSRRHVLVRLRAPKAPAGQKRPTVNVAFVLDRSGSMAGEKMARAKQAVVHGLALLEERDRFSIVAYDNEISVVVPSTAATPAARERAASALRYVDARGATNLSEGWLTGCGQVAEHLVPDAVGRALLLTDGLANEGIVDRAELVRHASELRRRGVSTSTFGVGADFDEQLLGGMADAGGGTFRFIDSSEKIVKYVASELGEALEVVARDVALDVRVPPGVEVAVVGPYLASRTGDSLRVTLPDLVSAQELDVVLALTFPRGSPGTQVPLRVRATDRQGALGAQEVAIGWTYAEGSANDAQHRNLEVDRAVAGLYAGLAREEAAVLHRDGRLEEASRKLLVVARKIGHYAGDDTALKDLVSALEEDGRRHGQRMDELERKSRYFEATSFTRSKSFDGSSKRS